MIFTSAAEYPHHSVWPCLGLQDATNDVHDYELVSSAFMFGNLTALVNDPSIDPLEEGDTLVQPQNCRVCEVKIGPWYGFLTYCILVSSDYSWSPPATCCLYVFTAAKFTRTAYAHPHLFREMSRLAGLALHLLTPWRAIFNIKSLSKPREPSVHVL